MAFDSANLRNTNSEPAGDGSYVYDAGSDDLAAVLVAGYFNNQDDALNLAADDRIWVQASDGAMTIRVSSVDSGSAVTTQFAGGNLPTNTPATNSAADATLSATLVPGHYDIGTAIASATRMALPTPYPGLEMRFVKNDSGSETFAIDAGGSGATAVLIGDTTNAYRRIQLQTEMDMVHLVGISTTNWRIVNMNSNASAVAPANAVFIGGTS